MTEISINKDNSSNNVVVGEVTSSLLERQSKLSEGEKKTLLEESVSLLQQCTSDNFHENSTTGLAFGYVQSGKTLSFTTITALAKDNGFRMVIIFAGTKNNLLDQTTERLKNDLLIKTTNRRQIKILQNPDISKIGYVKNVFNQKTKPLIIFTILKSGQRIDAVSEILRDLDVQERLGSSPVLIIDDEADQASLNTLARRNARNSTDDQSRTFESIISLRNVISNHTFLQYTATPQANLLIDLMNVLSPDFHIVLTPGSAYTGGQEFFVRSFDSLIETIPATEVYHHSRNPLQSPPSSLLRAMRVFYVNAALQFSILDTDEPLFSMMIHPDLRRDANNAFHGWVEDIKNNWIEIFEFDDKDPLKRELLSEFQSELNDSLSTLGLNERISIDEFQYEILDCLLETRIHLVIGGEEDIDWSESCHILIGGPKLDRGFTVKGLMVTYMPRHSLGTANADTIQQRCRFFGYKENYLKSCRVFLPQRSIDEYVAYVDHEEYLRNILQNTTMMEFSRQFILNNRLRPTRTNVLSSNIFRNSLSGARQTSALHNIERNRMLVEELISRHESEMSEISYGTEDRTHQEVLVNIDEAIEFISKFKMSNVDDIDLKSLTLEYLYYLKERGGQTECNIIEMAYRRREDPRVRAVKDDVEVFDNIFTGRSTSGSEVYPGDRNIFNPDVFNIQIHKIRVKDDPSGRVVYTLGFIYPRNLSRTFVSVN